MWGRRLGWQTLFFMKKMAIVFSHRSPCVSCQFFWKIGELFLVHCRFYSFHSCTRVPPIIPGMQTICHSSCGGPFLWGRLFGRTCWTCLNPRRRLGRRPHQLGSLDGMYLVYAGPVSPWRGSTFKDWCCCLLIAVEMKSRAIFSAFYYWCTINRSLTNIIY